MKKTTVAEAHVSSLIYLMQALTLAGILWIVKSVVELQISISTASESMATLHKQADNNTKSITNLSEALHEFRLEYAKGGKRNEIK